MNNGQIRALCVDLLQAETEDDVIALLTKAGYWDNPAVWRHYGDVENNWGQGGNQQSLAEAALVEKIVNAVDARLVNECLERGVDPKSPQAPRNIREAVSRFFEGGSGNKSSTGGLIEEWTNDEIRRVAEGITLCSTGLRPIINLTISDCGEGQTPDKVPNTILSLSKSNKMYIPFVQGQFNQGGTGALRFCGQRNFQLVVSRRNPKLLGADPEERDSHWGFTVVRRERPEGGRRNSIYTYLAPVGVGDTQQDRHGQILSFAGQSLNIYPDKNSPYGRDATFGTAIKLYDYKYLGERSNIIRGRSILSRLDLLLPEIALPIRMYEFRTGANGKFLDPGSRETTLSGLKRRLDNTSNVDDGFPIRLPFSPAGQQLYATVYVFKPAGTARHENEEDADEESAKKKLGGLTRYRKREGVLFVRNGQTQGTLPKDFFRRDSIKLKPLADDILVFVECDKMTDDVREDLFMPSRDRLTENDFKGELIDCLEQTLRNNDVLRRVRNERQSEQMTARMKDDKPLTDVLQHLIRSSPNLTTLLQFGQRITAPFSTEKSAHEDKPFKGELYPNYFTIKGTEYGKIHRRDCPINYRMRLQFETDARDDYFSRRIEGGQFTLAWLDTVGKSHDVSIVGPNLKSGVATVMATLPETATVGEVLTFVATVKDTRNEFTCRLEVRIRPEASAKTSGEVKNRNQSPDRNKKGDRERSRELAAPNIDPVYRERWDELEFSEFTAMTVGTAYDAAENEVYTFRVNMDNTPLLNEIKQRKLDERAARNQFMYANVLVGLSILLQNRNRGELPTELQSVAVEDRIALTCQALAPFMLSLTSLGQEDLSEGDRIDGLEAATG